MKILFVNAPTTFNQKYKEWDLSDVKSSSPPLAILYLASVARRAGNSISMLDGEVQETSESTILAQKPDLIAMTAMTINANSTIQLATRLKKHKIPILLGGVHATACREDMERTGVFYRVFTGEGELQFNSFLGGRPIEDNLDSLPYPAFDICSWGKYRLSVMGSKKFRSIGLVTSRGCFGKCHFCSRQIFGNRIRYHSADYILDIIERVKKDYGFDDFLFYDDLFVGNKERLREFCRKVKGITWSCCSRVDTVDLDTLRMMKSSGCWLIEYGIESGSQKILNLMGKGITLEKAERAVKWTKQAGIKAKGNFIFGYVGETNETLKESLRYIRRSRLDFFQHTFFTPLPGTEDYQRAEIYGEVNKSWDASNTFLINFIPTGLTRKDLLSASRKAFLAFYLNPILLLRMMSLVSSPMRFLLMLKAFLKTVLRSS